MILGEGSRTAGTAATLDDLFRRAGVRHPDAIALADPPNREQFTDGAPRTLSFAQADRAISAFAAKLRGLGLQTDTVVAIQLPNTVESIVAFLGVLRAGMIAAPVPLLWRRQEMVAALGHIGAKAIVTVVAHWDNCTCRGRDANRGRAVRDPPRVRLWAQFARRDCSARRRLRFRRRRCFGATHQARSGGRACSGHHFWSRRQRTHADGAQSC